MPAVMWAGRAERLLAVEGEGGAEGDVGAVAGVSGGFQRRGC